MAIFLVYSTSGITSGKKSLSRAQNSGHFENFEILNTASIWPQIWKDRKKSIFMMMMTSSMTSKGGLKVGPLYSFINGIILLFMITKQRAKISSLNFLSICIIRLWLQLYEYIFMTSLMTWPRHNIGQILKWIYLRQYLNYSVDQKLKMSETLMAIFLVYSPSGINSGKKKKFVVSPKRRPFWKFWNIKHSFNLIADMKRSSQIMKKKVFSWWWRHRSRHRVASKSALYIPLYMK